MSNILSNFTPPVVLPELEVIDLTDPVVLPELEAIDLTEDDVHHELEVIDLTEDSDLTDDETDDLMDDETIDLTDDETDDLMDPVVQPEPVVVDLTNDDVLDADWFDLLNNDLLDPSDKYRFMRRLEQVDLFGSNQEYEQVEAECVAEARRIVALRQQMEAF